MAGAAPAPAATKVFVGDSSNKNEMFVVIGFLVCLCCLCYCCLLSCSSLAAVFTEMQRKPTTGEE